MFPSAKTMLLTAASVSLALTHTAAADDRGGDKPRANPYVAGDMHNHNTCTDGSVSAGYAIDRSVATGVAAAGGNNFDLDWFTLGNHGGSGNRDCRFSDSSANIPGDTTTHWSDTLGKTIDGITITSLKGTPNGTGSGATMWRWQSIQEVEYPIIVNRTSMYNKVLVEGLEWIVPGHEHTDVAVIGLAKRLEEVWVPSEPDPIIMPRNSEGLYLLQRVRDEAHRFAIAYHRSKRSKRMTASALDSVRGLGEHRRKALVTHFGSLARLKEATVEEITAVPGIGAATAKAVLGALGVPRGDSGAVGAGMGDDQTRASG